MSPFPQSLQNSKGIWLVGVLIAGLCVYLLFSGGREDGDSDGDLSGIVMEEPKNTVVADSEIPPPLTNTDAVEGNGVILEQQCATFNFEEFTMENLASTLQQYFGLRVKYPAIARPIKLDAEQRGGNPLGEILAKILAPHGYTFFRQGDRIQIIEAEYSGGNPPADSAPIRAMAAKVVAQSDSPFDLWIDSSPALNLRVVAQPSSEESAKNLIGITIEGRREQRVWFRHTLKAPLGETVSIESHSVEGMKLFIKPAAFDKKQITIEARFEHEAPLPE